MKRLFWFPFSFFTMCVCSVAVLLAAPLPAGAVTPLSATPDAQAWVTNGTVYAVAIGPDGT